MSEHLRSRWNRSVESGLAGEIILKALFAIGAALILAGVVKRDWMLWATGALCFYMVTEA